MSDDREARRLEWQYQHDLELEERRQARAAERDARREQRRAEWEASGTNANNHTKDDEFELDMAARLSITVEEFRALVEQRREEMRGKPKIGYSPDHVVR